MRGERIDVAFVVFKDRDRRNEEVRGFEVVDFTADWVLFRWTNGQTLTYRADTIDHISTMKE